MSSDVIVAASEWGACMAPKITFKTRINDNETLGGGCAIGGEWKDVTTDDLFKDKKVVVFSLPGAYTVSYTHLTLPTNREV